MGAPLTGFFARRRIASAGVLLVVVLLLAAGHRAVSASMRNVAHLTGWLLLAILLALTFYNARKKLPFLPLAPSRTWLQFHAYAGWFSVAVFFAHAGIRWPDGVFEGLLAALFWLTALSGVAGMVWSRVVPRRLTARGGEVLFERIPTVRRGLAEQAETLALKSVESIRSTVVADFHLRHLSPFLGGTLNFWPHLVGSTRPLNLLLARLDDLNRFLNPDQRRIVAELSRIVRQKDGLDYHHAMQLSLRLWLFVHIPLTYGTLLLTALHVVLVYGFAGGIG